jgi:hypothetical protein
MVAGGPKSWCRRSVSSASSWRSCSVSGRRGGRDGAVHRERVLPRRRCLLAGMGHYAGSLLLPDGAFRTLIEWLAAVQPAVPVLSRAWSQRRLAASRSLPGGTGVGSGAVSRSVPILFEHRAEGPEAAVRGRGRRRCRAVDCGGRSPQAAQCPVGAEHGGDRLPLCTDELY